MSVNLRRIAFLPLLSLCIYTSAEAREKLNINRNWKDAFIEITTLGSPLWKENKTNAMAERVYERYDPAQEMKQPSSMMSLALNRPVTASSTKKQTDPKHVNNGDVSSVWEAEAGDQEKIWSVFLEDSYCVNQIELTFPDNKGYRYIVQVAKSDGVWKTVIDRSDEQKRNKTAHSEGDFGCDITHVRVKFVSECAALSQVRVGGKSVNSGS